MYSKKIIDQYRVLIKECEFGKLIDSLLYLAEDDEYREILIILVTEMISISGSKDLTQYLYQLRTNIENYRGEGIRSHNWLSDDAEIYPVIQSITKKVYQEKKQNNEMRDAKNFVFNDRSDRMLLFSLKYFSKINEDSFFVVSYIAEAFELKKLIKNSKKDHVKHYLTYLADRLCDLMTEEYSHKKEAI